MLSFSIPLSGLTADSDALSLVSNNLANMNTTGYKATTTQFRDTLYSNLGYGPAGNSIQLGLGTAIASNYANFTQGATNSTGVSTDMLVQGSGFFVLQNNAGTRLYSRDGSFSYGSGGALLGADGSNVMGWQSLNTNGTINTSAAIAPLTITLGQPMAAKSTTYVQMPMNLNAATSTPSISVTGSLDPSTSSGGTVTPGSPTEVYDSSGAQHALTLTFTKTGSNAWSYVGTLPASDVTGASSPVQVTSGTLSFDSNGALTSSTTSSPIALPSGDTLASGGSLDGLTVDLSALTEATGTPTAAQTVTTDFSTTSLIYDSLGGTHTVSYNFSKLSTNAWEYNVSIPGGDVTGGTSGAPVTLASGTMTFDPTTGAMKSVTQVTNGTANQVTDGKINLTTSSTLSDGASPLNLTWNLLDSSNNALLTQASATSAAGSQTLDGYASGTLQSIKVDADGVIEGVYSNNQTLPVGQLALASFANEVGLTPVGNGDYQATTTSGSANIGLAETSGRGSVTGGALEGSNVDIATEFSNLILAQRAYEANARTVTTFDQIYQDTISLKQA